MIEVIQDKDWALEKIGGTSLKGHLYGVKYSELIEALGQPTFNQESGDGKTQFEWVFEFDGDYYTLYDWKTYDVQYTINELTTWNIGGKSNAWEFIDALESLVKKTQNA
jgi:hypothetical protein